MGKIIKILVWHLDLIRHGVVVDYIMLLRSNPNDSSGQSRILKAARRICSKYEKNTPTHILALEGVADVYMRQHKFDQAASEFEKAIMINVKNGIPHSKLGYLYESLAACYSNQGNREKTISVISGAIENGVYPNVFAPFLDSKKLQTFIKKRAEVKLERGVNKGE